MKRMPGIPRDFPEPPEASRDPMGTPLRPPGDAPETSRRHPWNPMEHKNNHISTNFHRQKPSIAASESFCCNASPQRLPWTALCCIRREQGPFWSATGQNGGRPKGLRRGWTPL